LQPARILALRVTGSDNDPLEVLAVLTFLEVR
jgi:hypothetical protein